MSWKAKQQSFPIICNLVSFEETGGLFCKSKIYTMNSAGLALMVLREDNGILDKIKICWWRLRKRSPCKFLNNSKLLLENSKTDNYCFKILVHCFHTIYIFQPISNGDGNWAQSDRCSLGYYVCVLSCFSLV